MPQITRPQVYRVVRELMPRKRWRAKDLAKWLDDTQERNQRVKQSYLKYRQVPLSKRARAP